MIIGVRLPETAADAKKIPETELARKKALGSEWNGEKGEKTIHLPGIWEHPTKSTQLGHLIVHFIWFSK